MSALTTIKDLQVKEHTASGFKTATIADILAIHDFYAGAKFQFLTLAALGQTNANYTQKEYKGRLVTDIHYTSSELGSKLIIEAAG